MSLAILLGVFAILFFLGMPVAFAMIVAAWAYILYSGFDLSFMALQMFAGLDFFVLLAIPLFILASEVMARTSVAQRIFDFAEALVGGIHGGLGHVNTVTSVIFSGMSGSAVADVGGIGRLSHRAMVNQGYPAPFSAAVTATSAVIGPIIPPSIPMIVFSMVSGASIAKLFFAGAIPGLLIAAALFVYVYVVAKRRGYPMGRRATFAQLIAAFIAGFLPLMTPVILLASIYLGIVTITEAAAVAVLYALALGIFVYRALSWQDFLDCMRTVFIACGAILILLPAAKVFGFALTAEGVSNHFAAWIMSISDNPIFILIAINVLFIVLGCISDPNVNIMLFVPIVMPLANAIGLDPIHFGMIVVLNCMIGLVTPPVGGLLFAICGMEKLRFETVVNAMWPFLGLLFCILALVTAFPALSLWLPGILFN
ncbi:tripartite ATP-independent transporter DctM subunit [Mycoplana sp. BE70]|uniref:TRAP transporter large permease n=1 Tax=Mycoplana sp. BE70 TaxID=2817775 RepID=UPI002867799B|nr:TRAP transporter large permease [Mycoplana sp. BE70]MDR6756367.1 tripartite ATP-independent transporter DctM subunit [Mycoplana sp. BE70]